MKLAPAFLPVVVGVAAISAAVFYFLPSGERGRTTPALRVRAVAHQWWWEFDYASLGIRTSDVLYLPSGRQIQLELVSGDVIHSFWIEGMKDAVDIIPGKARLLDVFVKSPGELYGSCDSGCGSGTVCMRFRLLASPPVEFQRWAVAAPVDRSGFNVPRTSDPTAVALVNGDTGHIEYDSSASRLQQLLDRNSTASQAEH
jgi:heme/copper-type cytochrome/quinol oxidase subunit 2